ncbi:MAG: hypothetical protein MUO63_03735 [Desulfobulbaceae bacterium]|nr:hypothetical protein [Desulfobulbaceae bacterium]
MLKLIAAIALSLSLIFLVKESVVALRGGNTPAPPASEGIQAKLQTPYPAGKNVIFYPPVPVALPDLNKGYLFNEERMIEGAAGENGDGTEEDSTEPFVDMDTVFYAGSIIIGEMRKGLVMFPPAKAPFPTRRTTAKQAPAPPKERKYAQLGVGDSFSGYKVVAVEPERIVFQKGPDTIEKILNDPNKTRIAAPPPPPKERGKIPTAVTSKTKRVQLDKAKTGSPGQSSGTVKSTTRRFPSPDIQVPEVPAPPATE